MHNKKAHSKSHDNHKKVYNYLNGIIMWFTAKMSTYSIVHSKDGVEVYKKKYKKDNIIFLPHPVYEPIQKESIGLDLEWDYVIWGRIEPYKNIYEFLKYFTKSNEFKNKKLLICGRCTDKIYLEKINSILDGRITFINDFLKDDELNLYIKKSKVILFTYNPESIFCSGALIYSLNSKKKIIGPNVGFFNELKEEGLITTYNRYSDIVKFSDKFEVSRKKIDNYIYRNTWGNFAKNIKELLKY